MNSCSPNDPLKNSSKNLKTDAIPSDTTSLTIRTQDAVYQVPAQNEPIAKWVDNEFQYNIVNHSIDRSNISVELLGNDWEDGLLITDQDTGEKMWMINIQKDAKGYSFDISGNGMTINGYHLRFNNGTGHYKTDGWFGNLLNVVKAVIKVNIEFVVHMGSDGSMKDCNKAMNDLHCPEGTTPYMHYTTGMWGGSCSVGCH